MTDWDRSLPQVMGAYNSTQHSTTGVSPHMMLTGHEKSLPLTFFNLEFEGKKTSPQVYVRDVIRRQQELNDLCRRNTQQTQARQRKRFDKKTAGARWYFYVLVFQNVIPPKGTKKLLKKWKGPFMITEVHQEGRFYRLSEREFGTGHLEPEFITGIWNRCEPEFGTGQSDRTKLTKK